MNRCSLCSHIFRPDEDHICPTADYLEVRDALVEAAAQEAEDGWWNGVDAGGVPCHWEE